MEPFGEDPAPTYSSTPQRVYHYLRTHKLVVSLVLAIIILIVTFIWFINRSYKNLLDGVWIHTEPNGVQSALIIDTKKDNLKIYSQIVYPITYDEFTDISIKTNANSWLSTYERNYTLTSLDDAKKVNPYSQLLLQPGVSFDMYASEGTIIFKQDSKDICMFTKDNDLKIV